MPSRLEPKFVSLLRERSSAKQFSRDVVRIGGNNVCGGIDEAIERARQIIGTEISPTPTGKQEHQETNP